MAASHRPWSEVSAELPAPPPGAGVSAPMPSHKSADPRSRRRPKPMPRRPRPNPGRGRPRPPTHHGVRCDGCSMNPILNCRYKCMVCADYDLCRDCAASKHQHHPFVAMPQPATNVTSSLTKAVTAADAHPGTTCAGCGSSPIIGFRYKCTTDGVELCHKCELGGLHDKSHARLKIPPPTNVTSTAPHAYAPAPAPAPAPGPVYALADAAMPTMPTPTATLASAHSARPHMARR